MSDRRKYEGEEELQLQLLEVTQDPTFGKQSSLYKKVPPIVDGEEFCELDGPSLDETKSLH